MELKLNADGTIQSIQRGTEYIGFRADQYGGLRLYIDYGDIKKYAELKEVQGSTGKFVGRLDQLDITLTYTTQQEEVIVAIEVENTSLIHFKPVKLGVHLGIDTYMEKYPEWNDKLFPTLMRCEQTHFWGYMMSPKGTILAMGTEEPVASWSLAYNELPPNHRENIYMKGGHRIYTANLDLINRGPLPKRHPLIEELGPKEKKTWTLHMKVVDDLEQVQPTIAALCTVPSIRLEQYTLEQKQLVEGKIDSHIDLDTVYLIKPCGTKCDVKVVKQGESAYTFAYQAKGDCGLYTLQVMDQKGQQTEATYYIKQPWSWYLKKAREAVVDKPPAYSHHIESFNSFFTIFNAKKHFNNHILDGVCELQFQELFEQLYDYEGRCVKEGKHRIQDTAGLAAAMGLRYTVTQDKEDLKIAGYLADSLMEKQKEDGAYYSGNTHYTSVTYLAKYMLELAFIEKAAGIEDTYFAIQGQKHFESAVSAIRNLIKKQDDIETEGEMTFEDGMISCSMAQISLYGLITEDEAERKQCIQVAEELYDKHRCLTQLVIPDTRMHGATLRFWEAQYNVNIFSNMMNSPCGWTAWKIYGDWYLYLLTYKAHYLKETMDTLGACMQLVDCQTGDLRWGFITDPYIETKQYVKGENGRGQMIDAVIGEQYVEMISGWHREEQFPRCNKFGIDHLVHEIFKALEEVALKNAYVYEDGQGQLKTYNCTATCKGESLHILPNEVCIDQLHLNLPTPRPIVVELSNEMIHMTQAKGFIQLHK